MSGKRRACCVHFHCPTHAGVRGSANVVVKSFAILWNQPPGSEVCTQELKNGKTGCNFWKILYLVKLNWKYFMHYVFKSLKIVQNMLRCNFMQCSIKNISLLRWIGDTFTRNKFSFEVRWKKELSNCIKNRHLSFNKFKSRSGSRKENRRGFGWREVSFILKKSSSKNKSI
jgi:hypothetical protein